MKILSCLYLCLGILCSSTLLLAAEYGGGTGYSDSPYEIYTPEQFNAIGPDIDNWDRCFVLMNDIDMSDYTAETFNSIGSGYSFSGHFNGQNFTIYNQPKRIFESFKLGTISNVKLVNATATGGGCLVGMQISGTISNCHIQGNITGSTDTGLLAGYVISGTISNCSSAGKVTGNLSGQRLGGLIGSTDGNVTISNCHSSASVTVPGSGSQIGGFIGYQNNGTIINCYATGAVSGNSGVGGFAGMLSGVISESYSTGDVTITPYNSFTGNNGGGFAGAITPVITTTQPVIYKCYSTGNITCNDNCYGIGGFAGSSSLNATDQMLNCHSKGNITIGDFCRGVGGLIGLMYYGTAQSCYSTSELNCGNNSVQLGGLIGNLYVATISNCYARGNVVTGYTPRYLGGLVGITDGGASTTIDKCYSTGTVTPGTYHGGLLGYRYSGSTVSSSFWDKDTSLVLTSAGGKGKTTAEMQDDLTFTSAGWDLTTNWTMTDYPSLSYQSAIGHDNHINISVPLNSTGELACDFNCLTGQSLTWSIAAEPCSWLTNIDPSSGAFTGTDLSTVNITVNSAGLPVGDYACQLTISASNGDIARLPVIITVYDQVDILDFAVLAQYWLATDCESGDNCKQADWYVDGQININDLAILAGAWLSDSIEKELAELSDGFETGDLTGLNWSTNGDALWTVTDSDKNSGTYSARTGSITNSQMTSLTLSCDITGYEINTISFALRYDSETDYDYLRFYIDGELKDSFSGTTNWQTKGYTVEPGIREFKWVYSKDSDGSAGLDCCWLDDVKIYKQ